MIDCENCQKLKELNDVKVKTKALLELFSQLTKDQIKKLETIQEVQS